MNQGHYVSMNTIMLSFVLLNKVISIIYCLLYKSLSSCAAVLLLNLRVGQSLASAPT